MVLFCFGFIFSETTLRDFNETFHKDHSGTTWSMDSKQGKNKHQAASENAMIESQAGSNESSDQVLQRQVTQILQVQRMQTIQVTGPQDYKRVGGRIGNDCQTWVARYKQSSFTDLEHARRGTGLRLGRIQFWTY